MSNQKIFVIGFNKTATTTFHELFIKNGLKSSHNGSYWDLDKYDCFSDNGDLRNFQNLHKIYPEAIFILNTRPLNKWLISRFEHGARHFLNNNKHNWAFPYSDKKAIAWAKNRSNYYLKVLHFFEKKTQNLIIVDISKTNWIHFIAKQLKFKHTSIQSKNISYKTSYYKKNKISIHELLSKMNYNDEQQSEVLINHNINKYFLQLYINNL